MKQRLLPLIAFIAFGGLLYAQPNIFDSYTYVSDTIAGQDATWYDLNGTAQAQDFQGADLGDFTTNLWLGGQFMTWPGNNGGDDTAAAELRYNIKSGTTVLYSGTVSYSHQAYIGNDERWGTDSAPDSSTDLIATHNIAAGDYNLEVWAYTLTTWGTAGSSGEAYDSNNSNNYTAAFTVVPENSMLALLSGSFFLLYVMLKRRLS